MIKKKAVNLNKADVVGKVVPLNLGNEIFQYYKGSSAEWGRKKGIGYPGEALERFVERNLHIDTAEFRAFLYAVSLTVHQEYEHYDGQKEQFAKRVYALKQYKKDGIVQLLVRLWQYHREENSLDEAFIPLLKNNEERLAAMNLLQIFNIDEESLYVSILDTIDFKALQKASVYENVESYKVLVRAYETYRFKKSTLKRNPLAYGIILHLWRLSRNEMKLDVFYEGWKIKTDVISYSAALLKDPEDIVVLNHLLMSMDREWQTKITAPALERVFSEFLKVEFTKETAVCEGFKKEVRACGQSLREVGDWLSRITNQDNLTFLHTRTTSFAELSYSLSSVSMLGNPLFEENGRYFVKKFINDSKMSRKLENLSNSPDLQKRTGNTATSLLQLIESKRIKWGCEGDSWYIEMLFKYGIYDSMDYEKIKEVKLKKAYYSYVETLSNSEKKQYEQYVKHLHLIPMKERGFLAKTFYEYYGRRANEKNYVNFDVYNAVEDKLNYLQLIFETNAFLTPRDFGDNLYYFYKEKKDVLEKETGITEEQILGLLEKANNHNLFQNDQIKKTVKELFMTEEEKQEVKKQLLMGKIRLAETIYDIRNLFSGIDDFIHDEEVQKLVADKIVEAKCKYSSDTRSLYKWLIQREEKLNKEIYERIEERLGVLIMETEAVDEEKLAYDLYVRDVFLKQKELEDAMEKENELCLQKA